MSSPVIIFKATLELLSKYKPLQEAGKIDLHFLGKKGFDFMKNRAPGCNLITDQIDALTDLSFDNLSQIASGFMDGFTLAEYDNLPYEDGEFDFIFGFAAIYMMNLQGVMGSLREIQRVGKGNSFITLGAYRTKEELELFQEWTLLGTTILHVDEWLEVFEYTGYTGDYQFVTAETLHLVKG